MSGNFETALSAVRARRADRARLAIGEANAKAVRALAAQHPKSSPPDVSASESGDTKPTKAERMKAMIARMRMHVTISSLVCAGMNRRKILNASAAQQTAREAAHLQPDLSE